MSSGFPKGIQKITSTGATITVTDPTGPTTDLEAAASGGITTITSTGGSIGITDPTGPTTDLEAALVFAAGSIPAPVVLSTNGTTKVFDTAALAVGTWLVTMGVTFSTETSTTTHWELEALVDTATATFEGQTSTELIGPSGSNQNAAAAISFIALVSVAGTLKLNVTSGGSTSTTDALAATQSSSFANATGYTALKIA